MSANMGKLPGKAEWAGRRRPMTRKSGFTSHPESTGGVYKVEVVPTYLLPRGQTLVIQFSFPKAPAGTILGFGGWFLAPNEVECELDGYDGRYVLTPADAPNWSKVGSQWYASGGIARVITLSIRASRREAHIALWNMQAGAVKHKYLETARPELMTNMYAYAPEANLTAEGGSVSVSPRLGRTSDDANLYLKACNRCARFLPINVHDERYQLSFSNHCVAAHRRPCSHGGFGRLKNASTGEILQLEYGFQLECRFCKKFEVNAAHNPQRTAGQMKEDAARRRGFELLLEELYGGTPQLRYRHITGRELADDVRVAFDNRCFKCGAEFATPGEMHLDHTRPLALLWPLDGTATALCATHNSAKRDRAPVDFYTESELARLSKITGIPLAELKDPSPNVEAIRLLRGRLDWFFSSFLTRPELQRINEGKVAADLLVKALRKVISRLPEADRFDLVDVHYRRR